jgi:peptide deformylase
MKILKYPHPFLFEKVKPVVEFNDSLEILGNEMLKTMKENNGVGLAANQVGVDKRIFVMQCDSEKPAYIFINPIINNKSVESQALDEGCLSVPSIYAPVQRAKSVTLTWIDTKGVTHQKTFEGLESVCVQHELEHLDGIVFIQKLPPARKTMAMSKYAQYRKKNKD